MLNLMNHRFRGKISLFIAGVEVNNLAENLQDVPPAQVYGLALHAYSTGASPWQAHRRHQRKPFFNTFMMRSSNPWG